MKGFFLQTGSAAMLAGLIYLVDCRVNAKGAEGIDRCYFTALPMMGIGIAGRGGFSAGYNTYNPALRKEEEGDKEMNEGQADERRKQRQRRKREKNKPGAEQARGHESLKTCRFSTRLNLTAVSPSVIVPE